MINIGIGISWAKAIYSVANNVIANFKARVLADNGVFEAGPCLDATLEGLNAIGLLDNASLVITPNAYTEGILYDVVPNTTLGDMTVVRATTATRVNELGLIEVVPRNLLTYSLNLSSGYTQNQCTIGASQTDPFGTSNAKRITNAAVVTDPYFEQSISFSPNTYTWSIYVKQGTALTATIRPVHVGIGGDVSVMTFTFATETIVTSGVITTSGFTKLTNGWYRIFCSVNITSAVSSLRGRFGNPSVANVYNDWAYPQLEAFPTATEYFPTTTRLNIPRIDYTNGSCPSILVEPQRTNVQISSEDFSNAIYLQIGVTVTTNTNVSPDGNTTANRLTEDTSTGFHTIDILNPPVVAGSYTVSVFVKANGRTKFQILGFYALTGNVDFDLTLGTATTTAPALNGKIENYGNGWYRCQATFTDLTGVGAQILFNILNNAGSNSYTGDGTSGLILWGAQLEAGTYSTSYIPTVASTVTRNADVISKTGISSLIGQTEGTIFVDIYLPNNSANDMFTFSNTGVNDIFLASNGGNLMARIYSNSTPLYFAQFPITSTGGRFKMAISYKSGNSSFYVNGTLLSTNTNSISFTTTLDTINLTNNQYAGLNNKEFNSIQLYKTALTDTECNQLTTL